MVILNNYSLRVLLHFPSPLFLSVVHNVIVATFELDEHFDLEILGGCFLGFARLLNEIVLVRVELEHLF